MSFRRQILAVIAVRLVLGSCGRSFGTYALAPSILVRRVKGRFVLLGPHSLPICAALSLLAGITHGAGAEKTQVLPTAEGWIGFKLGSDWKLTGLPTKPPQATAQFTKKHPVSSDTSLGATITITTFQTQWPEMNANYNQFINKIGGSKSVSGPWTVLRAGAQCGAQQYSTRTAYGNIADVHVIVTLGWFHLSNNDAQYDNQMDATFRSLLASISGGTGKPKTASRG
jgi:hypothetical protein